MNKNVSPQNANVFRCLGAMLYDSLLVFGLLFVATLIPSLILAPGQQPTISDNEVIHELPIAFSGLPYQLYLIVLVAMFFSLFWLKSGQTLGMQAWRLKLISTSGKPLRLGQCLLRLLGALISAACLGAGYWWMWIDKKQLSWHDHLSKTQLVLVAKSKK